MSDTKISALAELAVGGLAVADELVVVDKSDTTMGASGTDKRIKAASLVPIVVRKTADETVNNSTTLQSDDHLLWPVAANEIWFCQAWLVVTAASATMDFKVSFGVPSGTTYQFAGFNAWAPVGSAGTAGTLSTTQVVVGTGAATMGNAFAGTFTVGGTAGTVTLQWAQNTQEAADLTMKTNSLLLLWRLA